MTERTLKRWAGMVPEVVAEGSKAQIIFALRDAKKDIAELAEALQNARNAALEEAADILELRAANYERISCDVWQTDGNKRLYSAMEPLFLDAASAIRSLKSDTDREG
jgi:prophage maintenance system killer protein